MAKQIYRRTMDGFIPASDDASLFFGRCKLGELVTLDGKKARNLKFHRLFFAVLRMISENSNPPINEDAALHFAKLATGTGQVVTDSKGKSHFVPGSISFASMGQDDFDAFTKTAVSALVGRFMVGTAPDDVIKEAMLLAA